MSGDLGVLVVADQLRRAASGGIGTYARGLLAGIVRLGDPGAPRIELLASRAPGGRGTSDPLAAFGFPVRASRLPGPALTRAWDRRLLRAPSGFDVVHAVSLAFPEPRDAALVATVHDLLWRRLPKAYPERGRRWHEASLRRALDRADHFVVPSQPVADDLCEAGARGDAVVVIPLGSDHLPPPDRTATDAMLGRLGVDGPFLLSVGTVEPRKNQARLVEAYASVRDRLPDRWPLVVVGPAGWGDRIPQPPGVVLTGAIPAGVLSALYERCRLLAYVPLIEGFGLPPVEAMAFGAPVVASKLPSTGGAAFEVDPEDTESIAEGLVLVATDESVRAGLVDRGKARSRELRWSEIARRHLALWREVGAERSVRRG
jgi:glycosyltransferase involved in cell wall biosynthesis